MTRSGRNALFGFALYGPCSSWWYGLLDQYVLPEDPTSALAVAAKVAADQVAWAPVLVTTLFAWDLAWNGDNVVGGGLQKKLGADLLDTLKVNWSFWPVFHVLNFQIRPAGGQDPLHQRRAGAVQRIPVLQGVGEERRGRKAASG